MTDEPKPRPTRKELKATIRELRAEVADLQSVIRNRPPVFKVARKTLEGCAIYVTQVEQSRDVIELGFGKGAVNLPWSMTLQASGPFPPTFGGPFWLVPQNAPAITQGE